MNSSREQGQWKPFCVFDFSEESEPSIVLLERLHEIIKETTKELRGLMYLKEYHKERSAFLHIWKAEALYK